jgi:hypothetical protein
MQGPEPSCCSGQVHALYHFPPLFAPTTASATRAHDRTTPALQLASSFKIRETRLPILAPKRSKIRDPFTQQPPHAVAVRVPPPAQSRARTRADDRDTKRGREAADP